MPLLQTLHLAWQFVSKMGDHQRCFPMSYCLCCIASCLSCRHPWKAVWGDQRVVNLPPARRTRDLWVCDPDPSSWHGLTSGVVSRKGWCKLTSCWHVPAPPCCWSCPATLCAGYVSGTFGDSCWVFSHASHICGPGFTTVEEPEYWAHRPEKRVAVVVKLV